MHVTKKETSNDLRTARIELRIHQNVKLDVLELFSDALALENEISGRKIKNGVPSF